MNEWVGYFTNRFLIPALPRPSPSVTSDGPSSLQLGLTYGFGILILVVACVVLLVLILVLKHIQSRRRENDKCKQKKRKYYSCHFFATDIDHRKMAHDKMNKSPFNRTRLVVSCCSSVAIVIFSSHTVLTGHHSKHKDRLQKPRTYSHISRTILLHILCCDRVLSVIIIFCKFYSKNMKLKTNVIVFSCGIEK